MSFAVVGDTHGHLQLALCAMARWQEELQTTFEAVFLCGDVGTFTHESQIDSATRAHAKRNPLELEFLHQWSTRPQAPWLDHIFRSKADGGLGLCGPVVMVHGNHEGFSHLEGLVTAPKPDAPVPMHDLPGVDTEGHIRILPSGWRAVTESGAVVAGVGGIELGQRQAKYHRMAYINDEAVLRLCDGGTIDILLTHQGPSALQGEKGSTTLQLLLDEGVARTWFHGHSIKAPEVARSGRAARTLVCPLGDIAFPFKGSDPYAPGSDGWAILKLDDEVKLTRKPPPFLRDFRFHRWVRSRDGRLVSPTLAPFAWRN